MTWEGDEKYFQNESFYNGLIINNTFEPILKCAISNDWPMTELHPLINFLFKPEYFKPGKYGQFKVPVRVLDYEWFEKLISFIYLNDTDDLSWSIRCKKVGFIFGFLNRFKIEWNVNKGSIELVAWLVGELLFPSFIYGRANSTPYQQEQAKNRFEQIKQLFIKHPKHGINVVVACILMLRYALSNAKMVHQEGLFWKGLTKSIFKINMSCCVWYDTEMNDWIANQIITHLYDQGNFTV